MAKNLTIAILLVAAMLNPLLLAEITGNVWISVAIFFACLVVAVLITRFGGLRAKVWGVNICVILGICFGAEVYFRNFCKDKSVPNLYELHNGYYFNKPFLTQKFVDEEFISHYLTNCQGYRIDKFSQPKDSINKCDWLFIGDSFTQGAQVDYPDLYTTHLFRRFPDKVIVNAGISGAGLYDELNFYKEQGKELKPKKVFLQIGSFNDFFAIQPREATFQDWLMEKSELYRAVVEAMTPMVTFTHGRWTEPFFPDIESNRNFNIFYKESSDLKERDRAAFKDCIAEWKSAIEADGGELILILIPSREQVSEGSLREVCDWYNINPSQLDMYAPNKLLAETAKELGLVYHDLTDRFKSSCIFPYFQRDEHLNHQGHELVSEALGDVISTAKPSINWVSGKNMNERYPTLTSSDNLLFQRVGEDYHEIVLKQGLSETVLVRSIEQLIHPSLSQDENSLVYTSGDQDHGDTDVLLVDLLTGSTRKLNRDGWSAAIPMFNSAGDKIVFPTWERKSGGDATGLTVVDSKGKTLSEFSTGKELWRPIFSRDDKAIYCIEKKSKFGIVKFDLTTRQKKEVLSTDYDIWDISISPSGRYIAYAGNPDGNWDLFLYDLQTNKITRLTKTLGNEWDPSFGKTDDDLWYAGTFGINEGVFYTKLRLP